MQMLVTFYFTTTICGFIGSVFFYLWYCYYHQMSWKLDFTVSLNINGGIGCNCPAVHYFKTLCKRLMVSENMKKQHLTYLLLL
ncbi:unnamed protein product [Larinioides sclopetarius]|uniref:Uncharacterized protein n=1 Tax=Larinioides sclopetarius TaxID=280406 RepID=A0AAV2B7S3_9ARAC